MNAIQCIDRAPAAGGHAIPAAVPSSNQGYALDNSAVQASDRFAALSELFDAGTIHHLEQRGVSSGWHCLEVGGGGGSIATWLSERVGPTGRVLVTDVNTRFLDTLQRANLEVRQHNIVTDPLPEATFDLVHARLVLMHLPERDAVLTRLIKALKPGGWLLDEEFDVLSLRTDPDVNRCEAVLTTTFALNRVLTERGVELWFGRLLYGRLRALGLAEVGANARLVMGAGRISRGKPSSLQLFSAPRRHDRWRSRLRQRFQIRSQAPGRPGLPDPDVRRFGPLGVVGHNGRSSIGAQGFTGGAGT